MRTFGRVELVKMRNRESRIKYYMDINGLHFDEKKERKKTEMGVMSNRRDS
jgi:hypothetical protein